MYLYVLVLEKAEKIREMMGMHGMPSSPPLPLSSTPSIPHPFTFPLQCIHVHFRTAEVDVLPLPLHLLLHPLYGRHRLLLLGRRRHGNPPLPANQLYCFVLILVCVGQRSHLHVHALLHVHLLKACVSYRWLYLYTHFGTPLFVCIFLQFLFVIF